MNTAVNQPTPPMVECWVASTPSPQLAPTPPPNPRSLSSPHHSAFASLAKAAPPPQLQAALLMQPPLMPPLVPPLTASAVVPHPQAAPLVPPLMQPQAAPLLPPQPQPQAAPLVPPLMQPQAAPLLPPQPQPYPYQLGNEGMAMQPAQVVQMAQPQPLQPSAQLNSTRAHKRTKPALLLVKLKLAAGPNEVEDWAGATYQRHLMELPNLRLKELCAAAGTKTTGNKSELVTWLTTPLTDKTATRGKHGGKKRDAPAGGGPPAAPRPPAPKKPRLAAHDVATYAEIEAELRSQGGRLVYGSVFDVPQDGHIQTTLSKVLAIDSHLLLPPALAKPALKITHDLDVIHNGPSSHGRASQLANSYWRQVLLPEATAAVEAARAARPVEALGSLLGILLFGYDRDVSMNDEMWIRCQQVYFHQWADFRGFFEDLSTAWQLVLAEEDSTLKIAPKAGREGGYRPTILRLLDLWEDNLNLTLRDVFDEHQADDGPRVRLITQPEEKHYPSLEPDEDEDEDEITDDDVSMMLSSPPSSPIAMPPEAEAAASWPTFASFGEPA